MNVKFSEDIVTVAHYNVLQVALGTNPLTLMAPGKEDNFELDMATSAVAIGKVIISTFVTYMQVSRYFSVRTG